MKSTITRKDHLALVGLCELARRHNASLRAILAAAEEITGEDEGEHPGSGHCSDAVWNDEPDADAILDKLGITVAEG
jgi:hypothetical protein